MRNTLLAVGFAAMAVVMAHAQGSYVPQRVFDTTRGAFSDFEVMLADLARADVVFVGEQHDDPNTHRLERMVLEGLARRRPSLVVSLEMFERDVQEPLDHFLMGHMAEDEFLTASRPWPRYATDYKPLVDFAIAKDWPVVAANVPRALASDVSKSGLDVLKTKSDAQKKWFASDLKCPMDDEYFHRFAEAMGEHPATPGSGQSAAGAQRQSLERFYASQCVKDETMAESSAQAWQIGATSGARPLVVHFNGAFHSDFAEGTAERTIRRLPGKRVAVLSILAVENLESPAPDAAERKRADYLVYTVK
jgi:uncharacterized iron-regulated protein